MISKEDGSAVVESVFSMLFLMFLVMGVVQLGLTLYGRNVVAASAHEAARSAIELGADPASAADIADRSVRRGAGGVVKDIVVETTVERSSDHVAVQVRVHGKLRAFGPIPMELPITSVATASRDPSP